MELYEFYLILNEPELFESNKKFHFNLHLLKKSNKWDIYYISILDGSFKYNRGCFWDLLDYRQNLINWKYNEILYVNTMNAVNLGEIYPNSPSVNFNNYNWSRNYLINTWVSPYFLEHNESKKLLEMRLELVNLDLLED
jgi:hypothetical protein